MSLKIKSEDLASRYATSTRRLICRVSFEGRSLVVPQALRETGDVRYIAFASAKRSELAQRHLAALQDLAPRVEVVELDTENPIMAADQLFTTIRTVARGDGLADTVIDISSFRREELLMLLAILRSVSPPPESNCELVYVSVSEMAPDWISRTTLGSRSVLGYAGEIWPSRRTKLVVMIGFEIDRARSIIENYEPAEVALGMGSASDSISNDLYERNRTFFEDLRRQFSIDHTFEFSARDPLQTLADLEKIIRLDSESNVIIAPLNTKLSTVGAGLYALRHKAIQICYAPVGEYNETTYSTPGPDAYVVSLADLLGSLQTRQIGRSPVDG